MTIKIFNGVYGAYAIGAPVTTVSVTAIGYVGGLSSTGVNAYTIVNAGGVVAYDYAINLVGDCSLANSGSVLATSTLSGAAVQFGSGGSVANATGARIAGYDGIDIGGGAGTVSNAGSILGVHNGINLVQGGLVTNGASNKAGGLIAGKFGVNAAASATVRNYGSIMGLAGFAVYLKAGGMVVNGAPGAPAATLYGTGGILGAGAAVTAVNHGTIRAVGTNGVGAALTDGGKVVNGSASDTSALITGSAGVEILTAAGSVANYGTIHGGEGTTTHGGVLVVSGGQVVNGSATDTTALIDGRIGVEVATGVPTVKNFGTIGAISGLYGVVTTGGEIINGSAADTTALIQANIAVSMSQGAGSVTNFGTIMGVGAGGNHSVGAYLTSGGALTNGSASDTIALVGGLIGFAAKGGAGTLSNFGVVGGPFSIYGAYLANGGLITNGAATTTGALIQANIGILTKGAAATVRNFGTVLAGGAGFTENYTVAGAVFVGGGSLTNGSNTDAKASISGGTDGFYGKAVAATVTNFGTLAGNTAGVVLAAGGRVTNDAGGTIQGRANGVLVKGAAGTVVNSGLILAGPSGDVGVYLLNGGAVTNTAGGVIAAHYGAMVSAGSTVVNGGSILGAIGSGGLGVNLTTQAKLINQAAGVVSGYEGVSIGGNCTVNNYGTIQGWNGTGAFLVDPTSRLNLEAGSLIDGVIEGAGGVIDVVTGTATAVGVNTGGLIEGYGILDLAGGASAFGAGSKLAVSEIMLTGGSAEVATNLTDTRSWAQTGGSLYVEAFDQMTFTTSANLFTGTVTGKGTVVFSGGVDSFSGVILEAGKMVISGAITTFAGVDDIVGTLIATGTSLSVAPEGVTLAGGGELLLTNVASNSLHGASASATLTNQDTIRGAGQLGGGVMTLINAVTGVIEGAGSEQLIIDTGVNTIANSGLIEALSGNVTSVDSAVTNGGTLASNGGTLIVNGAVGGAGVARVGTGVLEFSSTFNEHVIFGASGRLVLANSVAFTNTVAGFSTTGSTSFDLKDIAWGSTTVGYSGTTTAGVLTVSDGTHTAHIHLTGNYLASGWAISSDGSGGTLVIDPPKPAAQAHALIAAAASLQTAPAAGSATPPDLSWRAGPLPLAAAVRWA